MSKNYVLIYKNIGVMNNNDTASKAGKLYQVCSPCVMRFRGHICSPLFNNSKHKQL